nr:hypothetical protein [Tanacetum cinerariifolium]
ILSLTGRFTLRDRGVTRRSLGWEAAQPVITSDGTGKKKGRIVTLTTDDMQKRKNDVKARTTLLLALPDEHQLRFSKHKTAQELWAAILKTFGGNEATKKTKKNLLKQQYRNFKAEGSETSEQTFNRLQVIVSHLEFMDIKIEKDDLNQKFLTSLPPEWLMHMIVWRNRSDLDTMSLDDLYNHLKVYEYKVQKKSESNSQNMAFISSAKHNSENEEVNIASVSIASTNVSTASANIRVASISQDTACAYIASQSSGSQIKFEDICNTPTLARSGILGSGRATSWINNTRYILNDQKLQFSKYKTARELWAAILKTFGGNEATKKTKKNLLKQQYGNFRAEGSETLEQTFSRLQVIIGQLQFMDVEVEQEDLNKKFLTSLAPEWLMHTIKKTKPNSQNMAFISSTIHSSGNKDGNATFVPTASTNVPTASASVATISQDTACAYIASQSSSSQIKFEYINQIDEDDMEEMDIKWNMALLSMRADKAPRRQDKGRRDNFRQGFKAEEQAPKALMAIDGVGWDWSFMENYGEDHALVANEEAPTEFALMANTSIGSKVFDNSSCSKDCLLTASKDLDNLIESQRLDKNKEGLGYTAVSPPPVQLYLSPKKDLSWTGLLECADDTVTDYSRPSPTVKKKSEKEFHTQTCSSQTLQTLTKTSENKYEWCKSNRTSFNKQVHSYGNRPFHRTSTVRSPYRPPCVPTVNKYFPLANRYFSTSSGNFPTANRKFSTASRKFHTAGTKSPTADMGMKVKAVKPSACWAVPRTKLMTKAIGTVAALGI